MKGTKDLPVRNQLLAKMRRMTGRDNLDAVHIDVVNMLLSPDCWTLMADALMEAQIYNTFGEGHESN